LGTRLIYTSGRVTLIRGESMAIIVMTAYFKDMINTYTKLYTLFILLSNML